MDPSDVFSLLPTDVLTEIIDRTPFPDIVNLYQSNTAVRQLLGCERVYAARLLAFVDAEAQCASVTSQQTTLLNRLNLRFRLNVKPPLSFAKLIRAYNHSALNPQCNAQASIADCLISAARLGLSEQVLPTTNSTSLYNLWQYQKLAFNGGRLSRVDETLINGLIITAYDNDYPELGDALISRVKEAAGIITAADPRIYYPMVKSWVRRILAPYKVKTSQGIRREFAATLFDADVPDDIKREIWESKYDFGDLALTQIFAIDNILASRNKGLIEACGLAKFGIDIDPVFSMSTRVVSILVERFAAESGSPELIKKYQAGYPRITTTAHDYLSNDISTFIAAKRGYFESTKLLIKRVTPLTHIPNEYWGANNIYIFEFLDKFSLPEVELLWTGLAATYGYALNHREVIQGIVLGKAGSLFDAYVAKYTPILDDLKSALLRANLDVNQVNIVNYVLTRMLAENAAYARSFFIAWFDSQGTKTLVDIWKVYGREQFEDSLMYISINFGFDINAHISRLYSDAVKYSNLGLIAYLHGKRLVLDITQDFRNPFPYKLVEMDRPGLIKISGKAPPGIPGDTSAYDMGLLLRMVTKTTK